MKAKLLKQLRYEASGFFELQELYNDSLQSSYYVIVENCYHQPNIVEFVRRKSSAMMILKKYQRNYILSRAKDYSRFRIFGLKFIL